MIDEEVTIRSPKSPDSALYPTRDWVVIEKLGEVSRPVTQQDFAIGMGPAFTVRKYLCRLAGAGNENKLAFMRIYKQIPIVGTEFDNSSVRQAQASEPRKHAELDALSHLTKNKCTATPRLLGYDFRKQDANDIVPGRYIMYFVWEKVPGDPLDIDEFWGLPLRQRQIIRNKFKEAYREVLRFGYKPAFSSPSKIILDKTTGDIKISGFRQAIPIQPRTEWNDFSFVQFFLVLISPEQDKDYSSMANDLKDVKNSGWRR
ncbi:hypothetical protein VN97_g4529 [Penicillium thymicola]|uniref:Uncharacterized protein n=1 Tax=Penicillium thymicola TaxID=293382 RepID=A0AAI9XA34_PENTH|nr:hypothetical protein VN97_g4529 [Penicillium thymicola]